MTARWVVRWTADGVRIAPWQTAPPEMEAAGLTALDGDRQAWLIMADGRVYEGAAAINMSLGQVWWLRPFTRLYFLPGVRQIADAVYGWVARNRSRLPGITPGCEAEFDCLE
jgi:predicted DCC family thiol-disulfide oxidoreductase YuxK